MCEETKRLITKINNTAFDMASNEEIFVLVNKFYKKYKMEWSDRLMDKIERIHYINILDCIFDYGSYEMVLHITKNLKLKKHLIQWAENGFRDGEHIYTHLPITIAAGKDVKRLKAIADYFDDITKNAPSHVNELLNKRYEGAFILSTTYAENDCFEFLYEKFKCNEKIKKEAIMSFFMEKRDDENLHHGLIIKKLNTLSNGMDMKCMIDINNDLKNADKAPYWHNKALLKNSMAYKIFKIEFDKVIMGDNINKKQAKNKKIYKM